MIEVLYENDYNMLKSVADRLGADFRAGSEGMIMREGGEAVGIALWQGGDNARLYAAVAPDKYGPYFDMLARSALSRLKGNCLSVTIESDGEYYRTLGFSSDGEVMTAKADDIVFPHNCRK